MTTITVEINDRAVVDALNAILERGQNIRPALTEIGQTIASEIKLGFRSSSDPWGNPWQRLADTTLERRRKGPRGTGSPMPLRDTGVLMNSLQYQVTDNSVAIGPADNAGKARMHQFGGISRGMFRGARIPARPYLPIRSGAVDLPQPWGEEVLRILNNHLDPR
jgi:phage virion morphogenesis protein